MSKLSICAVTVIVSSLVVAHLILAADVISNNDPAVVVGENRDEIIKRAKEWTSKRVPYCQCNGPQECCGHCPHCQGTPHFYRCDCSGYASYCLKLDHGYVTSTLPQVTHRIDKHQLKKGDLMLATCEHVVIFGGWSGSDKTHYVAYQEPGCHVAGPHYAFASVVPYPMTFHPASCNFEPYRKNGLDDDGEGRSANSNGEEDVVFATPEEIKFALQSSRLGPGVPMAHLENWHKSLAVSVQNHTSSLMLKYFGKII